MPNLRDRRATHASAPGLVVRGPRGAAPAESSAYWLQKEDTVRERTENISLEMTNAPPTPKVAPDAGSHVEPWEKVRNQPPYNVVLLDDDDHTYEYVVEMLVHIFGHSPQAAYLMAVEVDTLGRVIVLTTTLERAELERDRIHAYGADPRIARCKGSMSAIIEPSWD